MSRILPAIQLHAQPKSGCQSVLNSEALSFIAELQVQFNDERLRLLQARKDREKDLQAGKNPTFLEHTASVRDAGWQVGSAPADLRDRRVEITGPVEAKMMINALNSGANVFMADFEDALSPTWSNVIQGQQNLIDAVRKSLNFESPEGKIYSLNEKTATLVVRPRGWHLHEKHLSVDGKPVSASLFDFGLYFFHNAHELLKRGSGPYFYLPKMESHLEARLWNDVFNFAQDRLGIARGTIRATMLLETILAAFEMEEILFELKDHASGLNAGRWDYIFSIIKKFNNRKDMVLPDRAQVTMAVPFMRSYCDLLVYTCHKHGAHAMGGMAAFIPSKKDPEVNRLALSKVREDKDREFKQGFDGTWVAHPGLVPVAAEVFQAFPAGTVDQKHVRREDVQVLPEDLLNFQVPGGTVTEEGMRNNVSVALQYLDSWLQGNGAAAINNLMEDAATAEISRAQLWQWLTTRTKLQDGREITRDLYDQICQEELARLKAEAANRYDEAASLLDELVCSSHFVDFLTIGAYEALRD